MNQDPGVAIGGIIAFVLLLFGLVIFLARRGRPFVVELGGRGVPTENPGPGGALAPDSEWASFDGMSRALETLPAPPLAPATDVSTLPRCVVCPARATRMMPASGRGKRTAHAGGALLGADVELDHHGDRLYGQPRPEIIHTGAGHELCETHELVAFRLLENFHAGQRARMSTLTGSLALEAAAFEGAGLMRELKALAKGKPRGKA